MHPGGGVADWDRTQQAEAPPDPAVVYLELGVGCVSAFVAAGLVAVLLVGATGLVIAFAPSPGPLAGVLVTVVGFGVMGIGLTQWTWLLPGIAALFVRRRALALGLAIGGVMLAMLNGTCVAAVIAP
jgi:hypothetical protein